MILLSKDTLSNVILVAWLQLLAQYKAAPSASGLTNPIVDSKPDKLASAQEDENVCETKGCDEVESFLLEHINFDVDPCQNFYQFACGTWLQNVVIPPEKTFMSARQSMLIKVDEKLRKLLENPKISFGLDSRAINISRLIYRICMDTDQLLDLGSLPLRKILAKFHVDYPSLPKPLTPEFTRFIATIKRDYSMNLFWQLSTETNMYNASSYIMMLSYPEDTDSLTLGAKYFYKNRTRFRKNFIALKAYVEAISDVLIEDSGLTENQASFLRVDPELLVAYEMKLANNNFSYPGDDGEACKFPNATVGTLSDCMPTFDWNVYFKTVLPDEVLSATSNATELRAYISSNYYTQLLEDSDPNEIMNYIRWHVILHHIDYLDQRYLALTDEYGKVQNGRRQVWAGRWQVCEFAAWKLLRPVTAMYIDQYFTEDARKKAWKLAKNINSSFAEILQGTSWMDQETKNAAFQKLRSIVWHIGYPDYMKNATVIDEPYKSLSILPDDNYFEVFQKITKFIQNSNFLKLLKPVDKEEFDEGTWANAMSDKSPPSLKIPAAYLQAPYFDPDYPLFYNYAAVGATVGHELTHNFDNTGRKYDAAGSYNNWWSEESENEFLQRTQCMTDQYSDYYVQQVDLHVLGDATLDENIADNGGFKIAFNAYSKALSETPLDKNLRLPHLPYSSEQLFFITEAAIECRVDRPGALIERILTNPHPPAEFRVIGRFSNFDKFATAFNCKPGTPMNPLKSNRTKCAVW